MDRSGSSLQFSPETMAAPEKHQNSFCGATSVKQEPMEAGPLASPELEFEYISVQEENSELKHEVESTNSGSEPESCCWSTSTLFCITLSSTEEEVGLGLGGSLL
ncbi:uncharacterized protein LOC126210550 isoform X4 [Schistocerca nitens]|uniref:uncharacterized protein LOC126210550 isoform X4 n=1 Tax=Schistocerca nitens TaxID=7011 RepID=UPI0021199C2A|nr:uncharacterized protein LOC126210550 isoform X4 [Schistocerca nitens]